MTVFYNTAKYRENGGVQDVERASIERVRTMAPQNGTLQREPEGGAN